MDIDLRADERLVNQTTDMYELYKDRGKLDLERERRAILNFRDQVNMQLEAFGMKRAELSKRTGIPETRLSAILSNSRSKPNLTIKTLSRIASALGCSVDIRLNTFLGQQSFKVSDKPLPTFEQEIYHV